MKVIVSALLLLLSTTLFSSTFFPTKVFANVCEVKSGEIKLGGSETLYSEKNSWIEECTGTIEPVSDSAEICLFNQLKQWHCKVQQKADGPAEVSELTIDPEYATGFLAALRSLFDPDTEKQYGGLRLKDDEPLPGFPYSDILMPTQGLNLNIERGTAEAINHFSLVDVALGQEIFASSNPGKAVSVPANLFSAGKQYQWTMTSAEKEYAGEFSVIEKADQAEFDADLASALSADSQSGANQAGTAQDVIRAVVAREYGYTFDYQQSLDKARQSITLAE